MIIFWIMYLRLIKTYRLLFSSSTFYQKVTNLQNFKLQFLNDKTDQNTHFAKLPSAKLPFLYKCAALTITQLSARLQSNNFLVSFSFSENLKGNE